MRAWAIIGERSHIYIRTVSATRSLAIAKMMESLSMDDMDLGGWKKSGKIYGMRTVKVRIEVEG